MKWRRLSNFSANAIKQSETQYSHHAYENGACYEYVLGLGTEGFATEGGVRTSIAMKSLPNWGKFWPR